MRAEGGGPAWTPAAGRTGGQGRGTRAPRGPRWIISARAVVVLLAMAAAVVAVLWMQQAGVSGASAKLASSGPAKVAVPPLPGSTAAPGTVPGGPAPPGAATGPSSGAAPPGTPGGAGGGNGAGTATIHVVGAVKKPGIVVLPAGSRVFQAIDAAGGALPGAQLAAVNLAAMVVDGTQILVPTVEQAAAGGVPGAGGGTGAGAGAAGGAGGSPGGSAAGPGGAAAGLVPLNSATAAELDALPGVGPVMSERIVQWRADHGPFKSVDELGSVSGIGPKMLATLRPLVTVG
ncbi:competence protein ComEA [Arthrobacter silviterrae]|uniref:ComEA family DNA-binding protein n=1 Tax=Arthrobacter silviterrae TaxID=2026658 RepID=A0ABX0DB35_9MICC|nr:helix-hairpin-helix domain-containing protein [Arthrobacter silviterrae]MDQ0276280.1 competence protein ComEA [Arthrobacter silviterrae]NGN82539.1 ComEA family DNA-binding protein [Arthrobacter silviterrae]